MCRPGVSDDNDDDDMTSVTHLRHGVAYSQCEDVSKHVDFRVSLIELRGAVVSL